MVFLLSKSNEQPIENTDTVSYHAVAKKAKEKTW